MRTPYSLTRNCFILLIFAISLSTHLQAQTFTDDFSGDLSAWTAYGGTWQIQNGELWADYGVACGSASCSQAHLILNDEYQISDNWRASIDFTRVVNATHADLFAAQADFSLFADNTHALVIAVGGSGWNYWGTQVQDSIIFSVSKWENGLWQPVTSNYFNYSWDPNVWHTASIEKQDLCTRHTSTEYFLLNTTT